MEKCHFFNQIGNALDEELNDSENPTVANFATVATDGKEQTLPLKPGPAVVHFWKESCKKPAAKGMLFRFFIKTVFFNYIADIKEFTRY